MCFNLYFLYLTIVYYYILYVIYPLYITYRTAYKQPCREYTFDELHDDPDSSYFPGNETRIIFSCITHKIDDISKGD